VRSLFYHDIPACFSEFVLKLGGLIKNLDDIEFFPSLSFAFDDSFPGFFQPVVLAVDVCSKRESMKKTRPPGLSALATTCQNLSKRSGGTCESQKAKKTTSYFLSGCQLNKSACRYFTLADLVRSLLTAMTSGAASTAVI